MTALRSRQPLPIWNGATLPKNGTLLSEPIEVTDLAGYFSLQWSVTSTAGTARVKFEALLSNNGEDFLDVIDDIAASQSKTTGPDSDGLNMASFAPKPCCWLQIKATETANAEAATISAWLLGY